VYPFTVHHRLLDLISAASGLSVGAGAVVNIFHRDDPGTPHSVVLDPSGANNGEDHNPELAAGTRFRSVARVWSMSWEM